MSARKQILSRAGNPYHRSKTYHCRGRLPDYKFETQRLCQQGSCWLLRRKLWLIQSSPDMPASPEPPPYEATPSSTWKETLTLHGHQVAVSHLFSCKRTQACTARLLLCMVLLCVHRCLLEVTARKASYTRIRPAAERHEAAACSKLVPTRIRPSVPGSENK